MFRAETSINASELSSFQPGAISYWDFS